MTSRTPITTPFTREPTADEGLAGVDLAGKRAIVTGGASGIGVETARALASAGGEVTLAVRKVDASEQAAADITLTTGNKKVVVAPLELTDHSSVAAFTAAWRGPLHILVNNAGINVLFALGATARWSSDGITANALNPGPIKTKLQRHIGEDLTAASELQKTPQQGAATSVLLATPARLEGVGGRYFEDCNEAERVTRRMGDHHGVAPYALDPENADHLSDMSTDMLAG